jgi:uncharacterized protein YecT (DUF1311 family)
MVRFRSAVLSAALFCLGSAEGLAVDCTSARTSIEETICSAKSLLEHEAAPDNTLRRLLSRLEQGDHDRLVDEQIRWSKGRDAKCAIEPLRQRETCIDQMTEKRTQGLQKRLAALPPPRATADKAFEGHWESCQKLKGTDVCDSYTLFQKERRICGLWSYFATNSIYDGRLVWTVADKAAATNYICGRPGSESSYWCPGTMLGSIPESATGWQKVQRPEWSYALSMHTRKPC